jgi:hypothetical protein
MEFVEEASKRVDRERLDQFSNATVLSKRLDVVKKKVEGFDKNLDRDFPGMMQELYGLFRQLFVQNRVGKC